MADTGFELTDQTRDRYARALPKDPLTGEPVYPARDLREKRMLKALIFYWDAQHWPLAREALQPRLRLDPLADVARGYNADYLARENGRRKIDIPRLSGG